MDTIFFVNTTLNSSKPRRMNLNGKVFLVVDTTILKPRVLIGSKGPLFYPKEEIAKSFKHWLGTPLITPSHPLTENGQPIRGKSPYAWVKYDVGRFFPREIDKDGGIKGESWFDEEEVRKKEPRLLDRLNSEINIEVSTGLDHQTVEHETRNFNGVSYNHTAVDYIPDHIAILMDEKGACPNEVGCGILFNSSSSSEDTNNSQSNKENRSVEKTQLIDWLTLNCDCWKDPADKQTLDGMSIEKLKKLKEKAEESKRNALVVNSVSKKFGESILTLNSADAFSAEVDKKVKEFAEKEVKEVKEKTTVTTPTVTTTVTTPTNNSSVNTEVKKPMDMKEWLASMPEEARPTWNNMVESSNREISNMCNALAAHLTNNSQDEKTRKAAFDSFAKLPHERIKELFAAIPTPTVNAFNGYNGPLMPSAPVYAGAQGGYVPTVQEKEPEPLGLSGWNWDIKK